MSGNAKPFASLAPVLLARKGGARPATRAGDDGAMGDIANDRNDAEPIDPRLFERPPIKHQQERLLHSIADANDQAAARGHAMREADNDCGHRVAFTLRLDAERHLRLRLASAVAGASAQVLLTEALDQLLDTMPDIESLAAQVRRGPDKS